MQQIDKVWQKLEQKRSNLVRRAQKYAGLTLPMICTPDGYDENSDEMSTDYQSVGAQAVNNLANKLMLALFAPSRPFFRYDVPDSLKASLVQGGMDPSDVDNLMAVAEKKAISHLEQTSSRPKLYQAMKHLVVTGNVLMVLPKAKDTDDEIRVIGLKHYVVKRNQKGKVICIIVKEEVCFDELAEGVQEYLAGVSGKYTITDDYGDMQNQGEKLCCHYTAIYFENKSYKLEQAVDEIHLPSEYDSKFTEDNLPYRALTWDLADENNYGSGLVEQCSGDLFAISTMSESILQAAVLASEFRWLVNPGGVTSVTDFQDSQNGDAIPGVAGDITPLNNGSMMNLQGISQINTDYINRIGKTFLLMSSVVRDAERVTAEEIRSVANELETSLGGVYSRLAIDFQKPIAYWLTDIMGVTVGKDTIKPVVITGLDALSRNGDLENLQACISDMAQFAQLPPMILQRVKVTAILNAIFSARGLAPGDYVETASTAQANGQAQATQDAAVASAPGVAKAQAEGAVQAQQPQGQ